jgi:hypothetical protein
MRQQGSPFVAIASVLGEPGQLLARRMLAV